MAIEKLPITYAFFIAAISNEALSYVYYIIIIIYYYFCISLYFQNKKFMFFQAKSL